MYYSNEENIVGNPIGWLQELCMSRRWPPPIYETEMEVGLPHERQFTIACTIGKYREVGQGKSKKIAKRLAAHKMWNRLQSSPMENVPAGSTTNNFEDDVEQVSTILISKTKKNNFNKNQTNIYCKDTQEGVLQIL